MAGEFSISPELGGMTIGETFKDLRDVAARGLRTAIEYLGFGHNAETGTMLAEENPSPQPAAGDSGETVGQPMGDRFAAARAPVRPGEKGGQGSQNGGQNGGKPA